MRELDTSKCYRQNSDGTYTEIKGIELFCELHPKCATALVLVEAIVFMGFVLLFN